MDIKYDTLVTYREGYPSLKSYNFLYACSCEVSWQIETWYISYYKVYIHETWQKDHLL